MSLVTQKKVFRAFAPKASLVFTSLTLLTLASPLANASGICLSLGTAVFGGATLASVPGAAACQNSAGLLSNAHGGAIITTTPTVLPSPISNLTAATLGYSDPSGNVASATANLNAGTVGAFDNGGGPLAELFDVVHFHITDTAQSAQVGIKVHLSGSESGGTSFINNFQFTFVGVLQYEMTSAGFLVNSDPGWGVFANQTLGGFDYNGTINVTDGEAIPLLMALTLNCSNTNCDFSHTGSLGFTLPGDVTFTSDSGVLLTQTASSAAPEPAVFGLMADGLVCLCIIGKNRKALNTRPIN
jgi:hypothetical protein